MLLMWGYGASFQSTSFQIISYWFSKLLDIYMRLYTYIWYQKGMWPLSSVPAPKTLGTSQVIMTGPSFVLIKRSLIAPVWGQSISQIVVRSWEFSTTVPNLWGGESRKRFRLSTICTSGLGELWSCSTLRCSLGTPVDITLCVSSSGYSSASFEIN